MTENGRNTTYLPNSKLKDVQIKSLQLITFLCGLGHESNPHDRATQRRLSFSPDERDDKDNNYELNSTKQQCRYFPQTVTQK